MKVSVGVHACEGYAKGWVAMEMRMTMGERVNKSYN